MGSSKDYPNVAEWKSKDTGYHTGDLVKYKSNVFLAAYWAGKEPGVLLSDSAHYAVFAEIDFSG